MAIFYVDLENGNDANNGTSFALRKKTLSSAMNLSIFAGDEVRVMGSRPGTLLGTGTWTSKGSVNTSSLSISSISAASPTVITTTTAHGLVTGDWIRIGFFGGVPEAHGFHPITYINATSFSIPVSNVGYGALSNQSGQFVIPLTGSVVVMSSSLPVKNICWNGYNHVNDPEVENFATTPVLGTVGNSSSATRAFRSGDFASSASSPIISGYPYSCRFHGTFYSGTAGTGKLCYMPLAQPLDLSQYKQLTFYLLLNSSGTNTLLADDYRIQLCSDSTGDTVVNEFIIPGVSALNRWIPFTISSTTGGFLSSSIRSVRINKTTHRTTATFCITSIIACKGEDTADCLSLNSLLYTDRTGDDSKWPIRAILPSYNAIVLDAVLPHLTYNTSIGNWRPYNYDENRQFTNPQTPTSSSTSTYVINPIQYQLLFPSAITSSGSQIHTTNKSGSVTASGDSYNTSYVKISGGWNRTDMTTQDGITWITAGHGWGVFQSTGGSSLSFNHYANLGLIRLNYGWQSNAAQNGYLIDNCSFIGVFHPIAWSSSITNRPSVFQNCTQTGGTYGPLGSLSSSSYNIRIEGWKLYALSGSVLYVPSGSEIIVKNCYANNCAQLFALDKAYDVRVENFKAVSIDDAGIVYLNSAGLNNMFIDCNWSCNRTITFTNATSYGYPFNNISFVRYTEDTSLGNTNNMLSKVDGSVATYGTTGVYPVEYWTPRKNISFSTPGGDERTIAGELLTTKDNSIFRTAAPSLKVYPQSVETFLTSNTYSVSNNAYRLMSIAVTDIGTVTVSMWIRANSNTVFPFIRVIAPHIGVPDIQTQNYTPTANTWEQLTLSFTPNKKGVVDILFGLRSSTTSAAFNSAKTIYIDDISVLQS